MIHCCFFSDFLYELYNWCWLYQSDKYLMISNNTVTTVFHSLQNNVNSIDYVTNAIIEFSLNDS